MEDRGEDRGHGRDRHRLELLDRSQNLEAENRSHITTSQPTIIGITQVTIWAFTWNRGKIIPTRSPAASGNSSAPIAAFASTLAWVSIAPFGLPVVPEVYIRVARSPDPRPIAGASPSRAASESSDTSPPSSTEMTWRSRSSSGVPRAAASVVAPRASVTTATAWE
jgi:hypothetical protein